MKRTLLVSIGSCLILFQRVHADIIEVTNNDGGLADGTLNAALQQAGDGDIIDCSPIAGQTISLSTHLPAIVPSLTILGSGVTIDGGSTFPVFSLAQGSATITDFIIQNGLSQGGAGGSGLTGGGGGTGGGGALYVHSGTTMTISTISLTNNQAVEMVALGRPIPSQLTQALAAAAKLRELVEERMVQKLAVPLPLLLLLLPKVVEQAV